MNKRKWYLDINRSIGSLAYNIFGGLLCDGCSKPNDKLYGVKVKDGGLSEDIYCTNCCKQMDDD